MVTKCFSNNVATLKEFGSCTHMSTYSSVIPWKELAGMKSILMLSAISLYTEEITFTRAVWLNYQSDKMRHIHRKKKSSLMNCGPVGGFAAGIMTLIDKSNTRLKINNLGST